MVRWRIIALFLGISLIMASCQHSGVRTCDNIFIDTTATLYVFYPNYKGIKWICSDSPDENNDSILFCCTATFSKDYSIEIDHSKVCGSHITEGKYYEGYQHHLINGAFLYSNGEYTFLHDSLTNKIKFLHFSYCLIYDYKNIYHLLFSLIIFSISFCSSLEILNKVRLAWL